MPRRPPTPTDQQASSRQRRGSATVNTAARPPTLGKLRALSVKAQKGLQLNGEIGKEVRESSDRSSCIIMTSIVERTLEQAILFRLGITEDAKIAPLFERDGSLATFYGCIHLAFAIDLIPKAVRDDLDALRRIRNQFAHSSFPITLNTNEIKSLLGKLNYKSYTTIAAEEIEQDIAEERKEFLHCCFSIMDFLLEFVGSYLAMQTELMSSWRRSRSTS